MEEDHILEMKLLKGSELDIEGLKIKPHTLHELVDVIGLDTYYKLIGFTVLQKKDVNEYLKLDKEVYDKTSVFQMLLANGALGKYIVDFLKFVTRMDDVYYLDTMFCIMVYYQDHYVVINKDNVDRILGKIFKAYCITLPKQEKEDFKPANEAARKLMEQIRKNRAKAPKPKAEFDLASIISGMAWKSANTNILDIWQLTLYQLYDGFYRLDIIDNYDKTLSSVYHGMMDAKQIDFKKKNWYRKYGSK